MKPMQVESSVYDEDLQSNEEYERGGCVERTITKSIDGLSRHAEA